MGNALCKLYAAKLNIIDFGTLLYLGSTAFVGVRQDVNCDENLMSFAPHFSIYRLLTATS
jgi:hypothetical protein